MRHLTATTSHIADFVFGALPILAVLGAFLGMFLAPLWYLGTSLGLL